MSAMSRNVKQWCWTSNARQSRQGPPGGQEEPQNSYELATSIVTAALYCITHCLAVQEVIQLKQALVFRKHSTIQHIVCCVGSDTAEAGPGAGEAVQCRAD